jgi:phosphomevalonate kinase
VKIVAPGKLVLTGAYAVLDGAPAIVAAVDRYAVADATNPENVDTSALHDEAGRKLGLGSSAASMVAAEAARAAARGADLAESTVRARLFRAVREAHARAQSGGSGVDVAASVYGGVLRYTRQGGEPNTEAPAAQAVALPVGLELHAFWSGVSARTSDFLARVGALRARSRGCLGRLRDAAVAASAAVDAGDARAFVAAARETAVALEELGAAADAPIVPPAFSELSRAAAPDAAFLPSGAGGGDVAVWLGHAPPSTAFLGRAGALGIRPLRLAVDRGGVRPLSVGPPSR